jgi:hypothetical protein
MNRRNSLPFPVSPVSASFPMPAVAETKGETDHQRAQDDANRHRQQLSHVQTPPSEENAAPPPEPESRPTIGTLINVRV